MQQLNKKLNSKIKIALVVLLMCFMGNSQSQNEAGPESNKATQKLYGYAADKFLMGELLYQDKLDNQSTFEKNWIVQQSQSDIELKRYAHIDSGKLQVHDPRGCTIWYKNKMTGPIMISYCVTAPSSYNEGNDIVPRDINQFWMANAPGNIDVYAKGGLFDFTKYNGDFKTYDDIQSYYASTGGGNANTYNRTTRMRRYPRKINGQLTDHLGLNNRDDDKEFLIVPNKEHLVQMVAANDIVQYIVDGKIVYEIQNGDSIDILNDANKEVSKAVWGTAPWTSYNEGYFGFRMTRTHHTYTDFKVYQLTKK